MPSDGAEQLPDDFDDDYYEEMIVEYIDNTRRRRVLAVILALLVLLLIAILVIVSRGNRPLSPPDRAAMPRGVGWVRSIYAWGERADQMLIGPVDVAVAPDGTIWTTTNKRAVIGFGPTGTLRRAIVRDRSLNPGDFIAVEGVAVSETGEVYVADFGKNSIMVFSPQGQLLREWGVQLPNEIDVRDGKVAVAAAYGVGIFDTQGKLIAKWGQQGKGADDFDYPHGIALGSDGNVYISDTQNQRVKAYTQDGRLLWIRKTGAKGGQTKDITDTEVKQTMQIPAGMTFDAAGRLLVVDPFEFQVLVLDPKKEGVIVARYGQFGFEDGRFAYPTGISYDRAHDWLAIADTSNNRVQIVRFPGTSSNIVSGLVRRMGDRPWYLCLLPLILLLVAIAMWVVRGRRLREEKAGEYERGLPLTEGSE